MPDETELLFRGLPLALVVVIAVAAVLTVYWAYRRDRRLVSRRIGRLLVGFRITVVAVAALLFVDAALRVDTVTTRRPELLLLLDGSASFRLTDPYRPAAQVAAEARLLGFGEGEDARKRLLSLDRAGLVQEVLHAPVGPGGDSLLEVLERRFRVVPHTLRPVARLIPRGSDGGLLVPVPDAPWTDLGRPVLEAATRRPREWLAAVLLFSDGGHNRGRRPTEVLGALGALGVPLFTIGVGASERPRDLRIAAVEGPRLVHRGDSLRLSLEVESVNLPAQKLPLRVRREGETIEEFSLEMPPGGSEGTRVQFPLAIPVERGGRWKLNLSFPEQEGEATAANNSRDFWVDVTEEKIRVLLLDGAPRWEYKYLRSTLENDGNLAAEVHLVNRPPDRRLPPGFPRQRQALFAFDVLILGDVESQVFSEEELNAIRDFVTARGGSLILVAGERGMPASYTGTPLEELIPVHPGASPAGTTAPVGNGGFRLRLTPAGERSPILRLDPGRERNRELWPLLPEQHWFAPHGGAREGAEVLVVAAGDRSRDGGSRSPDAPGSGAGETVIMASATPGAGRVFFSALDSTWRWRLRIGEEFFARFWRQLLRWAASERLPPGDGIVRLGTDRRHYEIPATVSLRALITDEGGSPVEGEEARADAEVVHLPSSTRRRVRLEPIPRSGGLFRARLKTGRDPTELEAGEYEVRVLTPAVPGYDQREQRASVRFVVEEPPSPEAGTLVRNEALLSELAARGATGGRYLPVEEAHRLVELLPGETIDIRETRLLEQWELAWPFFCLLVALLALEWIVRNRHDLA